MNTDANRMDALAVLAKGILGNIPYVGPIVGEVVGKIIPNQRIDRIAKLLEELRRRIDRLDRVVIEQRMKAPEGVDLLEDGFHQAARALSDERIHYIANVLKRGLAEEDLKHVQSKMLMQLLGQLTDQEIILLQWHNLGRSDAAFQKQHLAIVVAPPPRRDMSPDQIAQRILYDAREAHLRSLGLLFSAGYVGHNPQFDLPPGVRAAPDVTPLGRLLLKTILSDEPGGA